MSIKVMSWVWEHGPKDPVEKLLLLALADFANDQGECWPSMIGIGVKVGMTDRGARGVVRRLEAGGWLRTEIGGGRGGKSRYHVLMAENPEHETRNGKPGMVNPERGDDKPGTKRPETRNQRSAEPSVTIIEPSDREAASPASKRQAPRRRIPPDWFPSPDDMAFAIQAGLSNEDISDEADKFRDYHTSKGSVFADHSAAWRTWARNAVQYRGRNMAGAAHAPRSGGRSSIAAAAARSVARMGG